MNKEEILLDMLRGLSPVVLNAIKSDTHLIELYKRLSEIYSKAYPIVVQVSPYEFRASYSDEVNELYDLIHQQIISRLDQILLFYNETEYRYRLLNI